MSNSEIDFMEICLDEGDINVIFIKADGTERAMHCTRNPEMISENFLSGNSVAEPDDLLRVFDIELQEWRSFKPSTVISWSPVI